MSDTQEQTDHPKTASDQSGSHGNPSQAVLNKPVFIASAAIILYEMSRQRGFRVD